MTEIPVRGAPNPGKGVLEGVGESWGSCGRSNNPKISRHATSCIFLHFWTPLSDMVEICFCLFSLARKPPGGKCVFLKTDFATLWKANSMI